MSVNGVEKKRKQIARQIRNGQNIQTKTNLPKQKNKQTTAKQSK